MKSINIFKFVANASAQMEENKQGIAMAKTLEDAKRQASYAMGYVDCVTTLTNTMICAENNDVTAQMDALENEWKADIYQEMVMAADHFHDSDLMLKYADKRDEFREAAAD